MKKLTYIAQLSAVALLLVQMSSCDSMPDPSPISDKYARPEEVVETGIPVITDGGAVIYSPTNDNFRYAASMIANSDGTMSAWYSTPGGLNGSMPARTKLRRRRRQGLAWRRGQRSDLLYVRSIVLRLGGTLSELG